MAVIYVLWLREVKRYLLNDQYQSVSESDFVSINFPDGFALDEQGNFWLTSNSDGKVVVVDSAGTLLGEITIDGGGVTNCAFALQETERLYITAGGNLFSLPVLVIGRSTRGDAAVNAVRQKKSPVAGAAGATPARRMADQRTRIIVGSGQSWYLIDGSRLLPPR